MTEVVEQHDPGQELAVIEAPPRPAVASVAPQVTASELVQRLAVIEDAMKTAMKEGIDYGQIPGTTGKPSLLKPGAEKLGALFQLDVQLQNQKIWHDDGHLTVICRATVFHQPTGTRLGSGEGICTSREAKYAFRQGQRVCPTCGKPTVLQSRDDGRDEFFCWAKKGGCGAKFRSGSDEYNQLAAVDTSQQPNPNIADTYNTVDKMASKRARIDAVLAVTGASALFTQDAEDFAGGSNLDGSAAAGGTADARGADGNRRGARGGSSNGGDRPASDNQKNYIARLCEEKSVPRPNLDELTSTQASALIESIKAGTYAAESAKCPGCGAAEGHEEGCSEAIPF